MNTIIGALVYFLVLIGFPGLGFGTTSHFDSSPPDLKAQSADIGYHFAAKSHYEQQSKALELKIQRLIQRVQLYDRKPYLDPKGFRRSGLKLQLGNLMKEVSKLRQKIALHQESANQILEAKGMGTHNPVEGFGMPD